MDDRPADAVDRRSTTRRACLLGARYNLGTGWHPATLVDLSGRGCRMRVGEDLARGAAVRVQLTPPPERARAAVELSGLVVWCRLEGISHQVGVHFDDPPPDLIDLLEPAD